MIQIIHCDGLSCIVTHEYPSTPGGWRSARAKYADMAIREWSRRPDAKGVRIGNGHFSAPGCVIKIQEVRS